MKRSTSRVLTTHASSLPRPAALLEMNRVKQSGQPYDKEAWAALVRTGMVEVVRKQRETGVDVVNDGAYGKLSFLLYAEERLTGFELAQRSTPLEARLDGAPNHQI